VHLEASKVFKLPLVQFLPDKEIHRQFLFIGVLLSSTLESATVARPFIFWLGPKELLVVKWHKVREHLLSKRTESTRSWPHATNICVRTCAPVSTSERHSRLRGDFRPF
jgi:hypothetical protein